MGKASFYECAVAPGGSRDEIARGLAARDGCCGNFIATEGFRVYVDHHMHHQVIRDNCGLRNEELIAAGNFGVVEGNRFVARFVSSYGGEGDYAPVLREELCDCLFSFMSGIAGPGALRDGNEALREAGKERRRTIMGKKKAKKYSDEWYDEQDRKMVAREQKKLGSEFASGGLLPSKSSLGSDYEVEGFSGLVGGKITAVGFHGSQPEGGMAIDYEKDGKRMRTVFGYTDLGLWVAWQGERKP